MISENAASSADADIDHQQMLAFDAQVEKHYTEKGLNIMKGRYTKMGESPAQAMWRICKCVASGDEEFTEQKRDLALQFLTKLLIQNRFLPNTPTWTGAARGKGQLAACFVLPVEDTMESIFGTLKDAALVQATGGGTGFNFGHLRPSGSIVNSSQGVSSGPISFISAYDAVFKVVQQGGYAKSFFFVQ